MKVIFLDIDGVLNIIPKGHDKFGGTFHDKFVNNLKYIIDKTYAKIVISSSWRSDGLDVMKQLWYYRNLPGEVIDITPYLHRLEVSKSLRGLDWSERFERGHEIQHWLDNNIVESYVILDDDIDMLPHQLNSFVQCSDNIEHDDCIDIGFGLTKLNSIKAIEILNRK